MSRKQKRMGPVGCFGQIENIKRQSLISEAIVSEYSFMSLYVMVTPLPDGE